MSTIQNLKNFIRHGKQARAAPPVADQSTVHAQPPQKQQQNYQYHALSDVTAAGYGGGPAAAALQQQQKKDFSVAGTGANDNRNLVARANDAAAAAAGQHQQHQQVQGSGDRKADYDPSVLERIVAEERESKGKLPQYPGLDRWTLVEKMGDGAFSNVYRARDNTGRHAEVAIKVVRKYEMGSTQGDKVLHPDFKKQPKAAERANILKEVQIVRQLDHSNIVRLVEFTESRQYYYIVLELCPGGELFHQIVRLTYFSEDLSRHVIVQVAKALEYLHEEAGVVHRDIKPENLLFYPVPFVPSRKPKARAAGDEDKEDEGEFIKGVGAGGIGVIKIADFGLSKVIWDTQTMTPCGTVGYTAPEIVKDERYSKSVDMWALGCVLYTLLCGFPPFYDESIQTLTEKVAMGQYTFLSPWWDDISKSAQDLVSHLLTVDPDKRYDIKQFLNHPWIRESQEETSAAADAPPLATPMYTRHSQRESGFIPHDTKQQQPQQQNDYSSLDPPATGDGRKYDFRSPGVVNLREVFDVGYAVHRQEEEGKRRKNFGQGYRGGFAAAIGGGLNSLNEDMEEDDEYYDEDGNATGEKGEATAPVPAGGTDAGYHPSSKVPRNQGADVSSMEQKLRNTTLGATAQARQQPLTNPNTNTSTNPAGSAADRANQQQQQQPPQQGYGQHSAAVAAAARKHARAKGGPFELSLDNATLLGRRGKRNPDDEHDADHPRRGVMTAVR